jgi:hypothetical protein
MAVPSPSVPQLLGLFVIIPATLLSGIIHLDLLPITQLSAPDSDAPVEQQVISSVSSLSIPASKMIEPEARSINAF